SMVKDVLENMTQGFGTILKGMAGITKEMKLMSVRMEAVEKMVGITKAGTSS
ncbi:unnamed protein product, partial [Eruca vesicaria subsp. sativa]|nr:unnamed protein product [Eruca vesicaria subsp. sativa]